VSFQRLLSFVGRNAGDVAKSVLPGSLLAGGFGMLEGPGAALTYGLADAAAAFPATMAARALTRNVKTPWIKGAAENTANIGASLGSTLVASNLLYGNQALAPQSQQIAQQVEQRALVNNLGQVQLLSPGTNFQMAGMPDPENFQQLLNQRNNWTQYLSPEDQALIQQTMGGVV